MIKPLYKKNPKKFKKLLKSIYGIKHINTVDAIIKNSKNDIEIYNQIKSKLYKPDPYAEPFNRGISRVKDLKPILNPHRKFNFYIDIGCGDGEITTEIHKAYVNPQKGITLGIDYKNELFPDSGKGRIDKRKKINLINYDGVNIPAKNNSVDLITCFQSLHHIPNKMNTIKEIARVVKKNGIVIIREHDAQTEDDKKYIDIQHILYGYLKDDNKYILNNYKAYYESLNSYVKKFKSLGFQCIYIKRNPFRVDKNGYLGFKK